MWTHPKVILVQGKPYKVDAPKSIQVVYGQAWIPKQTQKNTQVQKRLDYMLKIC